MENTTLSPLKRFASRRVVRQFIKFAVVGVLSTAIDWGVHTLLYQEGHSAAAIAVNEWADSALPSLRDKDFDAAFTFFKAVSFIVATINGFIWNRRWTFRAQGKEERGRQLIRFLIINSIGLLINTAVASRFHVPGAGKFNNYMSLAAGTLVTMFWNFTGHKFWTFRKK